jgi:peptidase M49-like protein
MILAPISILLALSALTGGDEKADLDKKIAQFAPVDLKVDLSKLDADQKTVLAHLIEAGRRLDELFMKQAWSKNAPTLKTLEADKSPLGKARLRLFMIYEGPWDRVDHNKPFIPGVGEKPKGAGFYPEDATKEEVEAWMKALPEAERKAASGFFTVIERQSGGAGAGAFKAVPFSRAYASDLAAVTHHLEQAAHYAKEPTLKSYLEKRLKAFMNDDYYESDVAWMELDSKIEPTIGPYEVYEDEWFNEKAAYESFIGIRDDKETEKLARFSGELQGLENDLPLDPKYRNPKIGALAPIRVINEIFCSGDANHGVQTAAFNLPNDERVIKEKGSKRVMLKNVQEAKFSRVLIPISRVALAAPDQKKVSFDAFFTHILMHELMHGLGAHNITAGGKATTVREQLKEAYSAIEEAKADVSGLWAMQHLVDRGVIEKSMQDTMYTTYLASCFRSIRFGITEAHGKGIAMQLNFLLDKGGFKITKDGRFMVDGGLIREAVKDLAHDLLTIEAEGSYAQAADHLARLAVVRPEVQAVLDRLSKVPIDIAPRFVTADQLTNRR